MSPDPIGEADVPLWPWLGEGPPESAFPENFLNLPAEEVAPRILGARVRSTLGGSSTCAVVIEAEAYIGPHDPASHAAQRVGRTPRNASMFGPPGHWYVYRSYGVHWCLNLVTREEGYPSAVLIRALDPIAGSEVMSRRRGGRLPLAAGPGRVGQALGIGPDQDGQDVTCAPLTLLPGWRVPREDVGRSGRIGISSAQDWPLRFYVRGHPGISHTRMGRREGVR